MVPRPLIGPICVFVSQISQCEVAKALTTCITRYRRGLWECGSYVGGEVCGNEGVRGVYVGLGLGVQGVEGVLGVEPHILDRVSCVVWEGVWAWEWCGRDCGCSEINKRVWSIEREYIFLFYIII